MKKVIFIAAAIALLAGIGFWQAGSGAKTAPHSTFTTLDGTQFTTEDLRGKVVLIKFWATSCVTCVKQMPDTIDNFKRYTNQGYEVVAVAMAYDKPAYVENFTQTRELPFRVVHDQSGAIAEAFGNIQLTPTAFLIDKNGRIIKRYLGDYDQAAFITTVEKALAG